MCHDKLIEVEGKMANNNIRASLHITLDEVFQMMEQFGHNVEQRQKNRMNLI